jgi:N-acetylmuramoyl-L-alanine amidase
VRAGPLLCALALVAVPNAAAAPPAVTASATPASGPAPLHVVLTAAGDAAAYHWDFGDGATGDGRTVEHTYGAGGWTATVTATASGGETGNAAVAITAAGLTLKAPATARYDRPVVFRGAVVPAAARVPVAIAGPRKQVAHGKTRADGTFALKGRVHYAGDYVARTAAAASQPTRLTVVPRLRTALLGSGTLRSKYVLAVSVRPAGAGSVAVTINRSGREVVNRTTDKPLRIELNTQRLFVFRIRVQLIPADGYVRVAHALTARIVQPRLVYGARGPSVVQLASQLRSLHYAAPFTASFDSDLLDGVYAFEKVQGLARTGVVDASFWHRLGDPRVPGPRYGSPADHIEIDKTHQVLYVVRASRIALIIPVSTAGLPGRFTPVGRFSIYRKVTGFDPSPLGTLFDPMYFTGGYAIHGNPSVPPYPASHGCVRVPMWIAPMLYATNPYGETVYVY